MYVGKGKTRNSPENYHDYGWDVKGHRRPYPATVQLLSLEGVPQEKLNRNLMITTALLNKGVKFPGDYKNDIFRTIDLATTLKF